MFSYGRGWRGAKRVWGGLVRPSPGLVAPPMVRSTKQAVAVLRDVWRDTERLVDEGRGRSGASGAEQTLSTGHANVGLAVCGIQSRRSSERETARAVACTTGAKA